MHSPHKETTKDADEDHLQDTMAAKIQSKIKVVKSDHNKMLAAWTDTNHP